jgi:hypothetical protein
VEEYFSVVDVINNCYKKMLEIGKCREVFRPENNQVPELISATLRDEFLKAKKNIDRRYTRYEQTKAPMLKISCIAEFIPSPKNYPENTFRPTNRMIMVNEQILEHEFNTNNLNIVKCETCMECRILVNVKEDQSIYTCKKCQNRKDPRYFLRNNLHPVWYEMDIDGKYAKDLDGNRIPHFDRPIELMRLSTAEQLLIRRCANYVPSVHLSNGTFALKGHCVTFPQDISDMCNDLPLWKEAIVVFIRYIGNKDTSAVYPKSLRVNRRNVLEALVWLKKHNPFYADVRINEANLDWMNNEEEVNIGTNATVLHAKYSKRYNVIAGKLEHVSVAHKIDERINDTGGNVEDNQCDMEIATMHANQNDPLPKGANADIIKTFIGIANETDQSSKIMNFPPIDHGSPMW